MAKYPNTSAGAMQFALDNVDPIHHAKLAEGAFWADPSNEGVWGFFPAVPRNRKNPVMIVYLIDEDFEADEEYFA